MDATTLGYIVSALVVGAIASRLLARAKTPAVVAKVEKRLEDYEDAEIVKVVGSLVGRLRDKSNQQAAILDAQDEMHRKDRLNAQLSTLFGAPPAPPAV